MTLNDLSEKYPTKEFGNIPITATRHYHITPPCDHKNYGNNEAIDDGWRIELPHHCDEWIIGGIPEAQQFAKDLQDAIAYCEDNP